MAGDWLKFEANTPEKVEVLAITVEMGWDDPDLTVGKLLRVWRWFDQHTVEGNAVGVTTALLDRIIGVTGFAKAMVNVGWLIVADDGISLPNFGRHNGKTAKDRALTAKRVASHKVSAKANAVGNGTSVTSALPREEKRREDSKQPPIPPEGGNPEPKKSTRRKEVVSLQTFVDTCHTAGEQVIPADDPVFAYAEEIGIPDETLRLHWLEFRDRYALPGSKQYKDWRSVFRKSVRGNWLKLWYFAPDGACLLTTVGEQARRAHPANREAA